MFATHFCPSPLSCWLRRSLVCLFGGAALVLQAQTRTILSAEVYDYRKDKVYFHCVQTPFLAAEFHTNPGEEHHYAFESTDLTEFLINGRARVLLEPGDSLHLVLHYDNKQIASMEFSGTETAVAANRLLWEQEKARQRLRYKNDLLACAVLDVKPQMRIADSYKLLALSSDLCKNSKATLQAQAYVLGDAQAQAYNSFMEYPVMYASLRKQPISEQGIGDYYHLMDKHPVAQTGAALRNPVYVSALMRYCFYEAEKKAIAAQQDWKAPSRLEDMYALLTLFYQGDTLDSVLFHLLCNFIKTGKEVERADALIQDYKSHYNLNADYLKIIDSLLQ